MTTGICLDGKKICEDIKSRIKDINAHAKKHGKPRLTIISVCKEAHTSIFTFRSWRLGRNPSFAKLKPIYAVLEQHEKK